MLYELAYEEAGRALSEQQVVVDSFRSRAGLLLSAAAITTSFLGSQALSKGSSAFAWLAVSAFVGVAVASLGVLWPRHWELTTNPRDVIRTYAESEKPASVAVAQRDLALHRHSSVIQNDKALAQLIVFFQIASILLTAEVILWIAAIAFTG